MRWKAAAQDQPNAVGTLGRMYSGGQGVTPSWRRARELYKRASELGDPKAVQGMQFLTQAIAAVTSSGKTTSHHPQLGSHIYSRLRIPFRIAGRPPHG